MGKKIDASLIPAGTAGVTDATFGDSFMSILDPDVAVTGFEKYIQLGLAAAGGAAAMNKRHTGSFLNFGGI